MRFDSSNSSLVSRKRRRRAGPPTSAFQVDSGSSRGGGAIGPAARVATSAARLSAEVGSSRRARDRPVEHAVEIEIRRVLDAVGRRIGPDADQAVGIALVDGQQPAHPLVEMERLDDDDLLGVAERVVAVGEIGQMSGEIGDDVAPRLSRPLSAHDRLFRPFADAGGVKRSPDAALSAGPAG